MLGYTTDRNQQAECVGARLGAPSLLHCSLHCSVAGWHRLPRRVVLPRGEKDRLAWGWGRELTLPMPLASSELPTVLSSVGVALHAIALRFVVSALATVDIATQVENAVKRHIAVRLRIIELAEANGPVGKPLHTVPVGLAISVLAPELVPVGPTIHAITVHGVVFELTVVSAAIEKLVYTVPLLLALNPVSTICVPVRATIFKQAEAVHTAHTVLANVHVPILGREGALVRLQILLPLKLLLTVH
jgi:hypothetical protein